MKIEVTPSILACEFGRMNEEIASVASFSDRLHVDVMDGHFVPNISFGVPVVKWIESDLPQDCHLMISEPWKYAEEFVKAGATTIIVHSEVYQGEHESFVGFVEAPTFKAGLAQIKELGCGVGVSVKPGTPVEVLEPVLDMLDQVLVMTVEPGFGGQKFMPDMLPKVQWLREKGYEGDVGVDGGVNAETGPQSVEAGANILIAGSYIFKAEDRKAAADALR